VSALESALQSGAEWESDLEPLELAVELALESAVELALESALQSGWESAVSAVELALASGY